MSFHIFIWGCCTLSIPLSLSHTQTHYVHFKETLKSAYTIDNGKNRATISLQVILNSLIPLCTQVNLK